MEIFHTSNQTTSRCHVKKCYAWRPDFLVPKMRAVHGKTLKIYYWKKSLVTFPGKTPEGAFTSFTVITVQVIVFSKKQNSSVFKRLFKIWDGETEHFAKIVNIFLAYRSTSLRLQSLAIASELRMSEQKICQHSNQLIK